MPKFRIIVTEEVTMKYDIAEIEADNEEDASEIAEAMRVNGDLGEPGFVSVDEIDIDVKETTP